MLFDCIAGVVFVRLGRRRGLPILQGRVNSIVNETRDVLTFAVAKSFDC